MSFHGGLRREDQAPVIVLGMHKSGTTLVSEILHYSGIPMQEADPVGDYDGGNKMERESAKRLNLELLNARDRLSIDVTDRLDPQAVSPELVRKGREVVSDLSQSGAAWGFKDPRTVLAYDFWSEILPERRVVAIFRDPAEVFARYLRMKSWKRVLRSDPGYPLSVLKAWCIYNSHLLDVVARERNVILIEYDDLMRHEGALEQLSAFLGTDLTDRRRREMRRSRSRKTRLYSASQLLVRWRHGLDTQRILADLRARKIAM